MSTSASTSAGGRPRAPWRIGVAAQALEGRAGFVLAHGREQELHVVEDLDEDAAEADGDHGAEAAGRAACPGSISAPDADHLLHQDAADGRRPAARCEHCASTRSYDSPRSAVADVERDGAGFGLVQQARCFDLQRDRVADLLGGVRGLADRSRQTFARDGDAVAGQDGFGLALASAARPSERTAMSACERRPPVSVRRDARMNSA